MSDALRNQLRASTNIIRENSRGALLIATQQWIKAALEALRV